MSDIRDDINWLKDHLKRGGDFNERVVRLVAHVESSQEQSSGVATMTTDHDKLRHQIKNFRERCYEHPLNPGDLADLYCVLAAAESTLPKTKYDEVWHVESVFRASSGNYVVSTHTHRTREAAEESRRNLLKESAFSCVRVTGPHRHEVPA